MTQNNHIKPFCIPESKLPRVVVIGSGFAGINIIKNLKRDQVQVVLIDQNNFHQFQPLLYQVAISGLEPDSIVSPIRKLFNTHENLVYRMAKAERIETESNRLITDNGFVDYDYLVVATGSSTNFYGSKNMEKFGIGLKSIQDAINIRSWMLQNLEKAVDGANLEHRDAYTNFVIVGAGPAGVEMAGAIAEFKKYLLQNDYPEIDVELMKIQIIESGNRVLPMMSDKASKHALKTLGKLDVEVTLNTFVEDYDGTNVSLKTPSGIEIMQAKTLIWTAGVKGNVVSGFSENVIVPGNRLLVDEYNLVQGHSNVFAIGDVSAMITDENPKGDPMVAQVAIQQGQKLARNILSQIKNQKFQSKFKYVDKGSMATIGKKDAVADLKIGYLNGSVGWLLWSFIHLISITGFKSKTKVAFNWIMKYLSYEKANQLIIRKYSRD